MWNALPCICYTHYNNDEKKAMKEVESDIENEDEILNWYNNDKLINGDILGLLSFYELLGFLYFAGIIIYGQRLWQTIQKGGPMNLVR